MKELGRIRRWYYREGLSISAIVKKSGYARNTVKAWLKAPEGAVPTYRRQLARDTKIAAYVAQLTKALETDAHLRAIERDKTRYDWQHYIPIIERKPGALRNGAPFADMPAALLRLRALLVKREGGDRLMARVLASVPRSGLETVLVAVELVLESGNPSAEHIENVLNRLRTTPLPETVDTPLEVSEAPIADTRRYDRLRAEVGHA